MRNNMNSCSYVKTLEFKPGLDHHGYVTLISLRAWASVQVNGMFFFFLWGKESFVSFLEEKGYNPKQYNIRFFPQIRRNYDFHQIAIVIRVTKCKHNGFFFKKTKSNTIVSTKTSKNLKARDQRSVEMKTEQEYSQLITHYVYSGRHKI